MFTRMPARRRSLRATVAVLAIVVVGGVLVPFGSVSAVFAASAEGDIAPSSSIEPTADEETEAPKATATPQPTEAPEPAGTPQPTAAPEPPAMPESPSTPERSQAEIAQQSATSEAEATPSQAAQPLSARTFAAQAGESGCNYANAGTGAYAETLCWLDFSTITTEYVERNPGTNRTTCDRQWVWFWWEYRCRTTWHFDSVLDAQYGSETAIGTGTDTNETRARAASETAARADRDDKLPPAGGRRYGNLGVPGFTPYPITVTLQGGYTLTAGLSISSETAAGRVVAAQEFPTWEGAFLGNDDFYRGVGGNPALYQVSSGANTETRITLSNVTLLSKGAKTAGFSIVVADAESTDSGESIAWSRLNGSNFTWLPNTPGGTSKPDTMGNACVQSYQPVLGNSGAAASCFGGPNNDRKNGTAMLQVSPDPANLAASFSVTAALRTSNGLQGTAFGIIIARAQVTVQVADRIVGTNGTSLDETNFGVTINGGSTASTGATETGATTGGIPVLLNAEGTRVAFGATSPSGALAASYIASWQCFKTDPNSTVRTLWPTTGSSPTPPPANGAFALLRAGQFAHCTVTYTPPYLKLVKQVENGSTGASNVPADWSLSGTGTSSLASGSGATVRTAVAVGTYTLAETGPINPWMHGYRWTGLSCTPNAGSTAVGSLTTTSGSTPGTIAGGSVAIAPGNDVTCRFVNTAQAPTTLTLAKEMGILVGTAVPADFTLAATASTSGALAGPSGTASATGVVTPGTAYRLSESGGPATYKQDGAWSCVNQRGDTVLTSAGSISVPAADQVTCTVTNATARLTLLKRVDGASSTLKPSDFLLTASPAELDGPSDQMLDDEVVVGNDEVLLSGTGANTFDVRPRHEYTLSETSDFAYLGLSLQVYPGGYPADGNIDDSRWQTVDTDVVSVAADRHALYRFVSAAPTALMLPLTGGIGADSYLFGGAGVLLLGLLAAAVLLVRTRIRSSREVRLT